MITQVGLELPGSNDLKNCMCDESHDPTEVQGSCVGVLQALFRAAQILPDLWQSVFTCLSSDDLQQHTQSGGFCFF